MSCKEPIATQHHDRNIVGHNIVTDHTFGHRVAICCDMLCAVGSSLKMVKFFGQHF